MNNLTPREKEVLSLAAKGMMYKEIASELGISNDTVSTTLGHVYGKLGVSNKTEATLIYHGIGV